MILFANLKRWAAEVVLAEHASHPTILPPAPLMAAYPTAEEIHVSLLSALGKDAKKLFAWLGSPKGQATIAAGESIVETVYPAATGALNLLNAWGTEVIKAEALAAAAGQQTGSGAQKAAAVLTVITPELLSYCATNKITVPDAAKIQQLNNFVAEFLNVLGEPGSAPQTAPTATATAQQ